MRMSEVIRWGPLGPGGDPTMSLQNYVPGVAVSGLGEVVQWGPLGPGGDPAASLQNWVRGPYVNGLRGYELPSTATLLTGMAAFAAGIGLGYFMGTR